MDVSDTRDIMVRQATGMIVSMVSVVVSTLERLGRTWYCKTIWSLCWLHEQLIAMFFLLSLWFCFIVVNILVDHEELELAYDANIYTIRFTVTIHKFTVIIHQRGSQSQSLIHGHNTNTKFSMSQFTVTVTIHSQSQFTIHKVTISSHRPSQLLWYIRWLLFSSVSCFFYDCHQAIVIHHSVVTRSYCLRWWHWMMSTEVPWQPWVLICFFLDLC